MKPKYVNFYLLFNWGLRWTCLVRVTPQLLNIFWIKSPHFFLWEALCHVFFFQGGDYVAQICPIRLYIPITTVDGSGMSLWALLFCYYKDLENEVNMEKSRIKMRGKGSVSVTFWTSEKKTRIFLVIYSKKFPFSFLPVWIGFSVTRNWKNSNQNMHRIFKLEISELQEWWG